MITNLRERCNFTRLTTLPREIGRVGDGCRNLLRLRLTTSGKPGPVYLDFPADVLARSMDETEVQWPPSLRDVARERPRADAILAVDGKDILKIGRQPALINVVTDWRAISAGGKFAIYST